MRTARGVADQIDVVLERAGASILDRAAVLKAADWKERP